MDCDRASKHIIKFLNVASTKITFFRFNNFIIIFKIQRTNEDFYVGQCGSVQSARPQVGLARNLLTLHKVRYRARMGPHLLVRNRIFD